MLIKQMIEGKRINRTERQFERKLKDLQIRNHAAGIMDD